MKFIKNNSYNIFRLMLNQIGMMIFGIMLSMAAGSIESTMSDTLLLFVSIFATGFYMVLIYAMMWEQGTKDIIRVESGKATYDKYYGTKVALLANIPNLILGLIVFFSFLFLTFGSDESASELYVAFYAISSFLQSTYLGIVKSIFSLFNPDATLTMTFRSLVYVITVIPAVFTSTIAYILGCKNFKLFSAKKRNK